MHGSVLKSKYKEKQYKYFNNDIKILKC